MPKHFDPDPRFTVNAWEADTISELTSAAGVTIDGVLLKDGEVTTDKINEESSANGVAVDGVLLKDGGIICADGATIETDTINEATAAAGVTVDGVLIKDGAIATEKRAIVAVNANANVTAAQSGSLFVVSAADGGAGITLSLPATALGLTYKFWVLTLPSSGVFGISPVADDKFIGYGLSGVNDKDLQHPTAGDVIGDFIEITGDGADGWLITGGLGTWAIQS